MRSNDRTTVRFRRSAAVALLVTLLASPSASAQAVGVDPGDHRGDTPSGQIPRLDIDDVPTEVLDEVVLLLSAIHEVPDRAVFEARVPAAREVLTAVALDAETLPLHRPQALWALAQWGDEEVLSVYEAVLDEGDERLVHHALLLLGRNYRGRAVPVVSPYLEDDDLQLRLSAIAALAEVDTDSARAALEAALGEEPNPVARERLVQALQHVR